MSTPNTYSDVSFRCMAWSCGFGLIGWLVIVAAIWGLS